MANSKRMSDAARVINAIRGVGRIKAEAIAAKLTEDQQTELLLRYETRDSPLAWLAEALATNVRPIPQKPQEPQAIAAESLEKSANTSE